MNEPNIFSEVACGVCKTKVATRLCDFVTDYRSPVFFRGYQDFSSQELRITCDFPMCDDCAYSYNPAVEFCPLHRKCIHKIQPTKEMKKSIGKYRVNNFIKHLDANRKEQKN